MSNPKLFIVFLLVCCLFTSACTNLNKDEHLKVKSKIQEIPSSINGLELSIGHIDEKSNKKTIEITINNKSSINYFYGRDFSIEKKIKNAWYYVPFKDVAFESIGLSIQPSSQKTEIIHLSHFKNALTPGEYRVLKTFDPQETESNESSVQLAASFSIEE
ncbi:immunoglobulin-like domain-containing protein [Bacillus sp. JJ722]|uniref:immunoglobulin-like domain-containing protein n=1 Tax=Bacillus sp. JJ722 TaxID=3122973 RepID=UPI002FFF8F9A